MIRTAVTAAVFLLMLSSLSFAQHGHMADAKQPAMKMASTDVYADDVEATFMVMKNENHKNMLKNMKMKEDLEPGTTHNIMVLIRDGKTGRELVDVPVTINVTDPNDNEQAKTGSYKEMMKTYDAYFKMAGKGKYKIRVSFDIGGQKRAIGLSYDMG